MKKRLVFAFTLIELLVVIVIIAVLGSISFPVYNNLILSGRTAKSISNLRQIGIGINSFVSENNNRLPVGENTNINKTWVGAISPYLKIESSEDEQSELTDTIFYSPTSANEINTRGSLKEIPCTYSAHCVLFPKIGDSDDPDRFLNTKPGFSFSGGDSMLGHSFLKIKDAINLIFVTEGSQSQLLNERASPVILNPSDYLWFERGNKSREELDEYISESNFIDSEEDGSLGDISFRNKSDTTSCLMGDMSILSFKKDEIRIRNLAVLRGTKQ